MILLFVTQCQSSRINDDFPPSPSWRGLTIGNSAEDEVKALMGEPLRWSELPWGHIVYRYPNDEGSVNLPHLIVIDPACNCVVKILEDVPLYSVMLTDIIDEYGEPETIMSYENDFKRGLFIYATQGIAVLAQTQKDLAEAIVYEIRYFPPMTIEELLRDPWSEGLTNWLPSRWETYQYTP